MNMTSNEKLDLLYRLAAALAIDDLQISARKLNIMRAHGCGRRALTLLVEEAAQREANASEISRLLRQINHENRSHPHRQSSHENRKDAS